MTLLVRRRALLIFTILVVLITLAVALHGYVAMSAVAEGSLGAKLAAERVLFVSILAAMSTLSLGIALTVRAITLSAILDKLVNMNRMSGFSPELALERLGQVGEKINQLYRQASELSAKKSQKIGGLASLLQYVMASSDQLFVVTNPGGDVVHAGAALLERCERAREAFIGKHIGELIPGTEANGVFKTGRRSRDPLVLATASDELTLNPIFSADGEIHYFVGVVPRSVADEIRRFKPENAGPAAPPESRSAKRSRLPRLFGKRGRG